MPDTPADRDLRFFVAGSIEITGEHVLTARERFAGLDLTPLADAVAQGHLVTTGERIPGRVILRDSTRL